MVSISTPFVCVSQAAIQDCLHGMGAMCMALLEQLKADAKLAVKQALAADGPFELSPQASYLVVPLWLITPDLADTVQAIGLLAWSHYYHGCKGILGISDIQSHQPDSMTQGCRCTVLYSAMVTWWDQHATMTLSYSVAGAENMCTVLSCTQLVDLDTRRQQ